MKETASVSVSFFADSCRIGTHATFGQPKHQANLNSFRVDREQHRSRRSTATKAVGATVRCGGGGGSQKHSAAAREKKKNTCNNLLEVGMAK